MMMSSARSTSGLFDESTVVQQFVVERGPKCRTLVADRRWKTMVTLFQKEQSATKEGSLETVNYKQCNKVKRTKKMDKTTI